MTKLWDDFIPLIAPTLPGCPDLTLKMYLAISAADFCAKTYLWRDDIDAVYLAPNQVEYDLSANAEVEDVIGVTFESRELPRTDIRLVPLAEKDEPGEPRAFWVQSDRSIRIFPVPDKPAVLKVAAVLKPSRDATGVEDWIFETWADAIINGAVARLALIPGKEWTSLPLASLHQGLYDKAVVRARIRDFRGVPRQVSMQRMF
jgi:hypothetical protein